MAEEDQSSAQNVDYELKRSVKSGMGLAVFAVVMTIVAIAAMAVYMPPLQAFAYNSPFVLLSTVSFFLLFLSFDFISRPVNYIARSAFAVYLIHKAPLVRGNIMRPSVIYLWNTLSLPLFTLAAAGVILGFYLVAIAVDPLRRWMFDTLWRTSQRLVAFLR